MGMIQGRGRQDVSFSELVHAWFPISRVACTLKLSPSEGRRDDIGDGDVALRTQHSKEEMLSSE